MHRDGLEAIKHFNLVRKICLFINLAYMISNKNIVIKGLCIFLEL